MDKMVAIRLDGMLMGARAHLDGIAHYMKNNLSEKEFSELISYIGSSMMGTVEFSQVIHREFPDIIPKELTPGAS